MEGGMKGGREGWDRGLPHSHSIPDPQLGYSSMRLKGPFTSSSAARWVCSNPQPNLSVCGCLRQDGQALPLAPVVPCACSSCSSVPLAIAHVSSLDFSSQPDLG